MEIIQRAVWCIEERNFNVPTQPGEWDSDSFYHIVSQVKWGTTKHPKSARRALKDTQLDDNNKYFFLAFQPDIDEICKGEPEKTLRNILDRNYKDRENPRPRDIHAAAEYLAREIHILYYHSRLHYNEVEEIVFLPPFARFPSEDKIYILMVQEDDNMAYIQIYPTSEIEVNCMEHSGCHSMNFQAALTTQLEACLSYETKPWMIHPDVIGLYHCISQEMYGSVEFHDFVKDVISKYIENDDKLDIFYKFIGGQEENVKKKKETVKNYISRINEGTEKPGKAELYAAASIFRTQIYKKLTTSEWEVYHPLFLPGSAARRRSYVTMTDDMQLLIPSEHPCNCLVPRPEVRSLESWRKELLSWVRHVTERGRSCCPGDRRHDRHKHLAEYRTKGSSSHLYQRTQWSNPHGDTKTVLELLQKDGRTLDVGGTFRACIYKEIYHSDDVPDSFDVCSDSPDHNDIKSIACWLKRDIYIYSKNEAKQTFKWEVHKSENTLEKECRYYITLFHDKTDGRYDIITPVQGCNCAMNPPTAEQVHTQESVLLKIPKAERHNPMLEYFEDKFDDVWLSDETRRCMPRDDFAQISEAFARPDMDRRDIDVGFSNNSLYSCISKEIFGNENQSETIETMVADEIHQNPQKYFSFLSVKTPLKIYNSDSENEMSKALSSFLQLYGDIPILAASTVFQTPIYVLSVDHDGKSKWHSFTQIRTKQRPLKMPSKISVCRQRGNCDRYYLTLLRDSYGAFFRIFPKSLKDEVCNCQLNEPEIPGDFQPVTPRSEHDCDEKRDSIRFGKKEGSFAKILDFYRELDDALGSTMHSLRTILSLISTQLLLYELIFAIFENRRHNINIASISGSSLSSVGAVLVILGLTLSPATVGASLPLSIAGGVISGIGASTVVGAKITEGVLTKYQLHSLIVMHEVLKQLSNEAQSRHKHFVDVAKRVFPKIECFYESYGDSPTVMKLGMMVPAVGRFVGSIHLVAMIIARLTARATAAIVGSVFGGFSLVIDGIIIAYAAHNLNKGNKTATSEAILRNASQLKALKVQIETIINGGPSD